jgi:predicted ATPase
MRICVSGPQCTGKTTFIQDFLQEWPKYKTTKKTYRDVIVEENLDHSSKTSEETQRKILDWMVIEGRKYTPRDKIIFDRGPLDNLVYTMWAAGNGLVSEDFFKQTVTRVRNAMKYVDLIIIIPYDGTVRMEDDKLRDTNIQYQRDINDIFMFLHDQYKNNFESDTFFPYNDSPGIIVLSGSRDERITQLKRDYFDSTGDIYGDEHSILNPQHHWMVEDLITSQEESLEIEKKNRKIETDIEDNIKKLRNGL